jgi:hypothetical protein
MVKKRDKVPIKALPSQFIESVNKLDKKVVAAL